MKNCYCHKLLIALLLLFSVNLLRAQEPVRIWCLGDSITEGNLRNGTAYPSYRRDLYGLLKAKGINFDFVGTRSGYGPDNTTFPDANWLDQDHDGWGGYGSEHLYLGNYPEGAPPVSQMAQEVLPDIVLLHIGTNDSVFLEEASETIANINGIITDIRAVNPNVDFYVAQIIPIYSGSPLESKINAISAAIASDVPMLGTEESPVSVVDMYNGYDLNWFSDGVHPDFSGEAFIAQQWADAINVPEPSMFFLFAAGFTAMRLRKAREKKAVEK